MDSSTVNDHTIEIDTINVNSMEEIRRMLRYDSSASFDFSEYNKPRQSTKSLNIQANNLIVLNSEPVKENINDCVEEYFDSFRDSNSVNILIVDDEKWTRLSNKRLINQYADSYKINVNIIEAEDGIECLYLLFSCMKRGIRISFVVSDENMNYLDGSVTSTVMKDMTKNKVFHTIPFYVVTAYEDEIVKKNIKIHPVKDVFSKPLKKTEIEKMFTFSII